MPEKSAREKGFDGESKACAYLEKIGFRILERNFYTRTGEIDIIALDGDTLVFIEVKSLPHGTPEMLAALLGPAKRKKIVKTAKCYLEKHRQYSDRFVRFDVLAIDVPVLDPVHHIQNAFSE